jgi:hypothetical protein
MGYHVAILRTTRRGEQPITFEEASRAAAKDGHWQVSPEKQELDRPLANRDHLTLWLDDGRLWAKSPTEDGIAAMLALAEPLGARVRGDEFETYSTVDETYFHPDDRVEMVASKQAGDELVRRSKRQSILIHACIIGCFIALGLLAKRCEHRAEVRASIKGFASSLLSA